MIPKFFCIAFFPAAAECEKQTGIPAVVILAQAAIESSWGSVAPGFCFFGLKETSGIYGSYRLLIRTVYSRRADRKFPVKLNVKPVIRSGQKMFRYRVKDYFRTYRNPEEAFLDHCHFFLNNPGYKEALKLTSEPYRFIEAIAAAGYSPDTDYAKTLTSFARMVEKLK